MELEWGFNKNDKTLGNWKSKNMSEPETKNKQPSKKKKKQQQQQLYNYTIPHLYCCVIKCSFFLKAEGLPCQ